METFEKTDDGRTEQNPIAPEQVIDMLNQMTNAERYAWRETMAKMEEEDNKPDLLAGVNKRLEDLKSQLPGVSTENWNTFGDELAKFRNALENLWECAKARDHKLTIEAAKTKVSQLLTKGYNISSIRLDDIDFVIKQSGEIYFCGNSDELPSPALYPAPPEDEIPF